MYDIYQPYDDLSFCMCILGQNGKKIPGIGLLEGHYWSSNTVSSFLYLLVFSAISMGLWGKGISDAIFMSADLSVR